MKIIRATKQHLPEISRLFDLYRQFYECEADIELALNFIKERFENDESTIFIATEENVVVGFVQLYPSFCSVDAIKIYILYDLYIDADFRNKGIGALLMNKASEFAKFNGAKRVDLLTEFSNKAGQHLYEKIGYKKANVNFHAYSLEILP